jgi:hypothetical protein
MNEITQKQDLQPSDEINDQQLMLAKKQGEALQQALQNMIQEEARGQRITQGDYIIAWASEKAEGMYILHGGQLEWQEPNEENTHIEVAVCSSAEGRFIPGLIVSVTLIDRAGNMIGSHQQPFLWHPWLYHYGRNWQVPDEGPYTVWIRVEPPDFPRHDKTNGRRFVHPVEVRFPNVTLSIGRK